MPLSPATQRAAATLLFCHGGGFCKEVWTPIMTRLQRVPLMQRASPSMVSFDFPYHGTKRNVSEAATLHLENPKSPRVTHPAMHWTKWTTAEVVRQAHLLRAHDKRDGKRTPVIGIGHSMGAGALWGAEVANPGMFDGLILFEPICNAEDYGSMDEPVSFLVSITLNRRANWGSFEKAEADISSMRNFSRWHPESLKGYIQGAVVKVSPENNVIDPESEYALSCHPHIESSLYCGETLRLTEEEMARVQCPITFQYGARSQLFFPQFKKPLLEKYPHLYRIAEAVPDSTHALVMEDIDTIVSRIVDALQELPTFEPESRL